MALDLRPSCECCDKDLPPEATDARICSFECTFCAQCVDEVLHNVCPNCGGGFVPRPIRPQQNWRRGTSIRDVPPSTKRIHTRLSRQELSEFAEKIRDIDPAER